MLSGEIYNPQVRRQHREAMRRKAGNKPNYTLSQKIMLAVIVLGLVAISMQVWS